jgi:peroxiredoxin Q/BCP
MQDGLQHFKEKDEAQTSSYPAGKKLLILTCKDDLLHFFFSLKQSDLAAVIKRKRKTMALKINTKAPDFRLLNSENNEFHLNSELNESGILLLFYPKAFSPGCTREVCSFSQDFQFFANRGIRLVGISHDMPETLHRFRERHSIPFLLLSDPRRMVCRMYDAVYPFGLLTKRISYFIDGDGFIRHISDNLLNPDLHLREMRLFLDQLPARSQAIRENSGLQSEKV